MPNDLVSSLATCKPWAMTSEESLQALASKDGGISDSEAKERLEAFGLNAFTGKEKVNMFSVFAKQFKSPLIFLLLIASVLTFTLGKPFDTIVILLAVLVNTGLGFYREYHAETTLDKLTSYIKERVVVLRDGKEIEIDSTLVVPGDVIKLSYGKRVPADARLLSVTNLRIDEAVLTGESVPIEKKLEPISVTGLVAERTNMAHAGTFVVEGFGTALVFATGNRTEIGKIASIVSKTERAETPIQKGVGKLAWLILGVVVIIVSVIFMLGIYRGEGLIEMLILSVAVAVGAVPEALPIALTVILAVGAERIASKKGIVRKLAAAETLGSTTLIMTDKTGTLTLADMQLVGIYPHDVVLGRKEDRGTESLSEEQKKLLTYALSNIDVTREDNTEHGDVIFHGKPFEVNIAKAGVRYGVYGNDSAKRASIIIPFNSTHKFSVSETDSKYIIMGAPDILLKRSTVGKDDYVLSEAWLEKTSSEGKRLIGIAVLEKEGGRHIKSIDDVKDISFLGILALYDPIRKEVPDAIRTIERYGIGMVLVTGDMKGTALAVARELNWHVAEEEVLTGSELHELSDEELLPMLRRIKIFARITPEDKLRIGRAYQSLGEVVAMTGDGVNDAPALKAMDIGVSLGSGSDVAKSAADMVLLDDNFRTISMAIGEGRKILANIRKTFVYLMSNSLDAVFLVGGSILAGLPIPLSALQIIWVNFFTGSLPALAFAFDEDLDHRKKKITAISSKLIFTEEVKIITFGIGLLSSFLLFAVYYGLISFGVDVELAQSILFVCFASYILVIAYSFRSLYSPISEYHIFSNEKLNLSIFIASAILIATVTVPFMRDMFSIVPIPLDWIWFISGWLIANVALVELAKLALRRGWITRKSLPAQ